MAAGFFPMPSEMKFAFFLLYLIQLLPFRLIHLLADGAGALAYYLAGSRRRVGEVNLKKCFPEWSNEKRKAVLKRHFRHMGKLLFEYGLYWYAPAQRLRKLVRYQDKHHLDNALAAGEKVILLYPHFTAFEMAVYTLNQDVPLVSMYSHQKNKAMDEQILKGRHRYNNVFLIGRTEGLRAIIKQLRKSDAPFLYLPDQDFGRNDSVFVNFFGIPTATIAGLGRIAAMTGAKVVPAIPTREADNTVTLRFYPAWENFPSDDVLADTQRMNDFIEARAREIPEQYYWLHKRFKTRPEGEAGFY
ncbi:lipid A biosynthesis lauroyl acyltransferase [Neisseria chenwenguii]|uniref:Lipid A biosynthesis lauroyl acyltransferase n=1 Tax=Neisseria chenwenguii TaxID=1853278 RepID=A0A220S0I1_9NEIS|nr:lipid A biosynthesis lauroyl acyltransferase [Neisseria chenwenguii]ASK26964.1 lipid A biosynthesis lauroyl acyltransferase [Neisseria chenwenguii]ROV56134.1 lipid A biosynthesis lauroyl acyltransferase [Neisseria chenwenguii]